MKYLILLFCLTTVAQQSKAVDFISVSGQISLNTEEKSISGTVQYFLEVNEPADTITIDAQNMTFANVAFDHKNIHFENNTKQLVLIFPFQKGKHSISFDYWTQPKQALYFVGSELNDNLQVWTQGQGRYTSNWFPSFDDVNEKVIFELDVTASPKYQVISNGVLNSKTKKNNSISWQYSIKKPMSSYLLMLAVGTFDKHVKQSKSGIPLELYIEPADSAKVETTYKDSVEMFDFLEKEIGVKYPWEIYRQIPARDFLYAGMENTTATIFSSRYVLDSIGGTDRSYTNVNAHELAHQWFGDLVTAHSGKHHWLQEGFATYYALLAERDLYGDDYFYYKLYESAQQIKYASRTDSIPILNAKASSLSFYQKGAWALFVIHESIGDNAFKKAVVNYLKKHAFASVVTDDFLNEIKNVSHFDTANFSKVWLESVVFNTQQANELLMKNKMIKTLFEIEKLKKVALSSKEKYFADLLQSDAYFEVKIAILNQLKNEKFEAKKHLLKLALETNSVQVRQVVASTLPKIPESFRTQYESLLQDKSYQTQEIALFYLWNNFPENRNAYLNESKDWKGFNDYNLKIRWLSLAIATPEYPADKSILIADLIHYSSISYEASTRQNALERLLEFQVFNDMVLENLVNGTTHHMWQFSKFSRDSIRLLLKKPEIIDSFERILPTLKKDERFQLNRLLQELKL
jgi:aminopeptidase N